MKKMNKGIMLVVILLMLVLGGMIFRNVNAMLKDEEPEMTEEAYAAHWLGDEYTLGRSLEILTAYESKYDTNVDIYSMEYNDELDYWLVCIKGDNHVAYHTVHNNQTTEGKA